MNKIARMILPVSLRILSLTSCKDEAKKQDTAELKIPALDLANMDTLVKVTPLELQVLLQEAEPSFRHWIQGLKDTKVEELVVKLSPRLAYIFK